MNSVTGVHHARMKSTNAEQKRDQLPNIAENSIESTEDRVSAPVLFGNAIFSCGSVVCQRPPGNISGILTDDNPEVRNQQKV
jgi:hypothetical protein